MRSTSLWSAMWKICEYKRVKQTELFTISILISKMKVKQCYSLLLVVYFLCLIQGKIDEWEFFKWKATGWMEVSRNASGIESWKVDSMNPRLYSWQPNHGDRSNLYTKKPCRPPKFGIPESFPPGFSRILARKRQSAFLIVSKSNDTTLSNPMSSVKSLFLPVIPHRIPKPFYPSQDTGPPIPADVNFSDLANESTHRYTERRALRKHHQATLDAITELGLSEEQHRNLKAHVNRRFLVGYDCSKPMDVKHICSFIHDPCKPAEANNKETYEIQPVTQFQIVEYETRREFLGTRCERYISQLTYCCGNADNASPLPQETFYRHLNVLAQNECRTLQLGQYHAGDGKTYSIARNVQKEIN